MKNNTYQCVSCAFYDQLEILATYYKKVNLIYIDQKGETQKKETVFKNFKTVDKAEFVVLDDDSLLRLDKIVTVEEL